MWDFKKNRMDINFNEESEATLSHELEHGRQFMDGEIDYLEINGRAYCWSKL